MRRRVRTYHVRRGFRHSLRLDHGRLVSTVRYLGTAGDAAFDVRDRQLDDWPGTATRAVAGDWWNERLQPVSSGRHPAFPLTDDLAFNLSPQAGPAYCSSPPPLREDPLVAPANSGAPQRSVPHLMAAGSHVARASLSARHWPEQMPSLGTHAATESSP